MTSAVLEPSDDPTQDRAYRWAVRSLYLVALGLNAYLLWDVMKDDTEVQIQVRRLKQWWAKQTENCEGCRKRRAQMNRVLYEATEIVTKAREPNVE